MAIQVKQAMLDVLLYLYDNYLSTDQGPSINLKGLHDELEQAGFGADEISAAISVLEGLSELLQTAIKHNTKAPLRVYTQQECQRLDIACRGFLLFLEQLGILDAVSREWVVERAMDLESSEINLVSLKWIILTVLFNQPLPEISFASMVDLEPRESLGRVH